MSKTISSVVAALVCVATASPSHAQSFSPPSATLSGSGTIKLQQSMVINCNISAPFFNVMMGTNISIPAHSLVSPPGGSPLCYGVPTYGIWTAYVVPGSTTEIDIRFGFNQASACYGTIRANWNNATRTATFTNAVLPVVWGSQNCIVSGSITVVGLTIL